MPALPTATIWRPCLTMRNCGSVRVALPMAAATLNDQLILSAYHDLDHLHQIVKIIRTDGDYLPGRRETAEDSVMKPWRKSEAKLKGTPQHSDAGLLSSCWLACS